MGAHSSSRLRRCALARPGLALLFVGMLGACATTPARQAARTGSFALLAFELQSEIRAGTLDAKEARAIARALAMHEIEGASGDAGAEQIRAYQDCSDDLRDALLLRAKRHDLPGSVAALILLDRGWASPSSFDDFADDANAPEGWRAVGARSLVSRRAGARRRQLFQDGDASVRIGALSASSDAASADDIPKLLEAARLDPSPAARRIAILALGRMGGDRVVLALADLYSGAAETVRQAILQAWAQPRSFEHGGNDQLVHMMESGPRVLAIGAAIYLSRLGDDARGRANAVIADAVERGTQRERVYAIRGALKSNPLTRAAIEKAVGDDSDIVVQVEAVLAARTWRNELHNPVSLKQKWSAVAKRNGTLGDNAKEALVKLGAPEVIPLLESDLHSADERTRTVAGRLLAKVGAANRAAVLLADPSEKVRNETACAIACE